MKPIFTTFVALLASLTMLAQESQTKQADAPPVKKSKATGSTVVPKSPKGGEESAEELYKYGAFDLALPLYLDEYKKKPDPETANKIGICYLETNFDKKAALKYFELALAGYKGNDIALNMGKAYLYAEQFDEALKKFEQYKSLEYKNPDNVNIADKYISFCNNGKVLKAKPLNVTFVNLGDAINSSKADNMAFVDPNETFMIFNTNRMYISEFTEYLWDVMTSSFKGTKWKKAKSVGSRINSNDNLFVGGASPSLEEIVLRPDSYDHSGDLQIMHSNGKKFDMPEMLNANVNGSSSFETSGCLSSTGDTLYFSSDKPGGLGGSDIYYSLRMGEEWGVPQNMGPTINTPYNEDYPNISMDGKTLYFASEGHRSMGGYDIFVSKFNMALQEWSKPENIGYPINTTYDDYSISFTANPRYAFISSVRDGGLGDYDIYKVIFNNMPAPMVTYTGKIAVGDTASSTPIMQLSKNVSVKVYDKGTSQLYGEFTLNKASKYVVAFPPGTFNFVIDAEGYNKFERSLEIPDKQPENPIMISDIYLNNGDASGAKTAPKAGAKTVNKPGTPASKGQPAKKK